MACFVRRRPAGDLTQVYNVAGHPVDFPEADVDRFVDGAPVDLLTGQTVTPTGGVYRLVPYQAWWLAPPPL